MNNASNLSAVAKVLVQNRINNEAAIARQEGEAAGYERAKRRYTALAWALAFCWIVTTIVFLTRIV